MRHLTLIEILIYAAILGVLAIAIIDSLRLLWCEVRKRGNCKMTALQRRERGFTLIEILIIIGILGILAAIVIPELARLLG